MRRLRKKYNIGGKLIIYNNLRFLSNRIIYIPEIKACIEFCFRYKLSIIVFKIERNCNIE